MHNVMPDTLWRAYGGWVVAAVDDEDMVDALVSGPLGTTRVRGTLDGRTGLVQGRYLYRPCARVLSVGAWARAALPELTPGIGLVVDRCEQEPIWRGLRIVLVRAVAACRHCGARRPTEGVLALYSGRGEEIEYRAVGARVIAQVETTQRDGLAVGEERRAIVASVGRDVTEDVSPGQIVVSPPGAGTTWRDDRGEWLSLVARRVDCCRLGSRQPGDVLGVSERPHPQTTGGGARA